jgi:hypothetical protein
MLFLQNAIMTAQAVVPKNEVVQKARNYARRQDDWSDELEVIFVSLMNYLAGYGYQVGNIHNHFNLFRCLWDSFHTITPGSLSFNEAFQMITTSAIFIAAGTQN